MSLISIKPVDEAFYTERLRDFLPDKIIDIHTHVWLESIRGDKRDGDARTVNWPALVAKDNSIEDLLETYRLMLPGKDVTPLIFATTPKDQELDGLNAYVSQCAQSCDVPALVFSDPAWEAEVYEQRILSGGFLGAKSYLSMCSKDKPKNEITIFDYFPHHQLEVLDQHGWIMMMHIPRDGRLKDPANLEQMIEIDQRYPNLHCIIAHVGRAYCNEDVGNAFEVLGKTERLVFDFSANTNAWVFEQALRAVGPRRMLFGSDMPILRMRMRRITENGKYINVVPKGLYGDVSEDPNMREVEGEEAEALSFFLYEEIDAFRRASEAVGLTREDIEDVFHNNAARVIAAARA